MKTNAINTAAVLSHLKVNESLKKVIFAKLIKKSPVFYGCWRFIILCTTASHLTLSWARQTQSVPLKCISFAEILMLSSHLFWYFLNGSFPSGLPTKSFHVYLASLLCATHLNSIKLPLLLAPENNTEKSPVVCQAFMLVYYTNIISVSNNTK